MDHQTSIAAQEQKGVETGQSREDQGSGRKKARKAEVFAAQDE